MSMTKRHFEAIAAAISDSRSVVEDSPELGEFQAVALAAIDNTTLRIRDALLPFNPNFRNDVFLKAAGFQRGRH